MPLIKSCLARRQYTPFNGSLHICDTHTVFSVYVVIIQKTPVLPFDTFSKKWDKFIPFGLGQSLFHSKEEMAALRFTPQQHTEGTHSKSKCTCEEAAATHRSESGSLSSFPHIYILSFPVLFKFVLFHSFILGGTSKTAFESSNSFLSSSHFLLQNKVNKQQKIAAFSQFQLGTKQKCRHMFMANFQYITYHSTRIT